MWCCVRPEVAGPAKEQQRQRCSGDGALQLSAGSQAAVSSSTAVQPSRPQQQQQQQQEGGHGGQASPRATAGPVTPSAIAPRLAEVQHAMLLRNSSPDLRPTTTNKVLVCMPTPGQARTDTALYLSDPEFLGGWPVSPSQPMQAAGQVSGPVEVTSSASASAIQDPSLPEMESTLKLALKFSGMRLAAVAILRDQSMCMVVADPDGSMEKFDDPVLRQLLYEWATSSNTSSTGSNTSGGGPLRMALVSDDAAVSSRLRLAGAPVRFLASTPVLNADGEQLGVLCYADVQERQLDKKQAKVLANFGGVVLRHLQAQRPPLEHVVQQHDEMEPALAAIQQAHRELYLQMSTHEHCLLLVDASQPGFDIHCGNKAWEKLTGLSCDSVAGRTMAALMSDLHGSMVPSKQHAEAAQQGQHFVVRDTFIRGQPDNVYLLMFRPARSASTIADEAVAACASEQESARCLYLVTMRVQQSLTPSAVMALTTAGAASLSGSLPGSPAASCPFGSASLIRLRMTKQLGSSETIEGLELGPSLGKGSLSSVYSGKWFGCAVAVKVVNVLGHVEDTDVVAIESLLSRELHHPHLVSTLRWVVRCCSKPLLQQQQERAAALAALANAALADAASFGGDPELYERAGITIEAVDDVSGSGPMAIMAGPSLGRTSTGIGATSFARTSTSASTAADGPGQPKRASGQNPAYAMASPLPPPLASEICSVSARLASLGMSLHDLSLRGEGGSGAGLPRIAVENEPEQGGSNAWAVIDFAQVGDELDHDGEDAEDGNGGEDGVGDPCSSGGENGQQQEVVRGQQPQPRWGQALPPVQQLEARQLQQQLSWGRRFSPPDQGDGLPPQAQVGESRPASQDRADGLQQQLPEPQWGRLCHAGSSDGAASSPAAVAAAMRLLAPRQAGTNSMSSSSSGFDLGQGISRVQHATPAMHAERRSAELPKLWQSLPHGSALLRRRPMSHSNMSRHAGVRSTLWALPEESRGNGGDGAQRSARRDARASSAGDGPEPTLQVCIVMEHADRGNLSDAIERGAFTDRDGTSGASCPRLLAILTTASEVAGALKYLHACGMAHGNLSARNVLLSSGGAAGTVGDRGFISKIADVGLAAMLGRCGSGVLTVGQGFQVSVSAGSQEEHQQGEAPHSQTDAGLDEMAAAHAQDMYCLGVLMWQMYHGVVLPGTGGGADAAAAAAMASSSSVLGPAAAEQPSTLGAAAGTVALPLAFADSVDPSFAALVAGCTAPDPAQRTSAAAVFAQLTELQEAVLVAGAADKDSSELP